VDEASLLSRISALEHEVEALKKAKTAKTEDGGRLKACTRFLIANWVLLSFLFTIFTAVYVQYNYHIGYFESYRNISETKKLAEFYVRMGDRLMASSEWQAAEEAYRSALKLNPNDTDATFGIVKAEVFQPAAGQNYYVPEVVDAKLDYLSDKFRDDYQIDFLKAIRYEGMGKTEEAEAWLNKCIQRNPKFTGCYLQLGFMNFGHLKLPEAKNNFDKVLKLDPNSATASNNLAACLILQSDFANAARQFVDSYNMSPNAVTALNLGEAYWFVRLPKAARQIHQDAVNYLDQHSKDPHDRFISGVWAAGFLPLHVGDQETIRRPSVPTSTVDQKKALFHFELSIDQALLGNEQQADQEFNTAMKLDHTEEQAALMHNRFLAVENMVPTSIESKAWLTKHGSMLEQ
jgi:tetratricopeptide (TPR) repeat protein